MKILPRVITLVMAISLTAFAPQPAQSAQNCETKACIDVYVKDGRIVIEGRKGKGPTSTTTTVPAPKATPSKSPTPRPTPPKPKTTKRPTTTTKQPRINRPARPRVKKSATAETSLADKLVESLPTSGIAYQPSFSPLVKTPVYFWCDVPTIFTKKVEILGEVVNLRLKPAFIWHYGDGVIFATRDVGAAYPDGKIQHSYSKPGHYLIELITNWQGDFTIDGVTTPIPSELVTVAILPISVVTAPTRFMN